jgi:hypothetical protein
MPFVFKSLLMNAFVSSTLMTLSASDILAFQSSSKSESLFLTRLQVTALVYFKNYILFKD